MKMKVKKVKVLVTQSCLTLCNPMDSSQPGSSVHGILQARILEWDAISNSGHLPNPAIKPGSPVLQADSLPSGPPGKLKDKDETFTISISHFPIPVVLTTQSLDSSLGISWNESEMHIPGAPPQTQCIRNSGCEAQ